MRSILFALVLALGLSACASIPVPVVADAPTCDGVTEAIANIQGGLATNDPPLVGVFSEVLHLEGVNAAAFGRVVGWDGTIDEVLAYAVTGGGLVEGLVYVALLNEGCMVSEQVMPYETLAAAVRITGIEAGGI